MRAEALSAFRKSSKSRTLQGANSHHSSPMPCLSLRTTYEVTPRTLNLLDRAAANVISIRASAGHLEIRSDPRATQAQVRDHSGPDCIRPHRESHGNFDLHALAPPVLHDRSLAIHKALHASTVYRPGAIRMSAYVFVAHPEGIHTGIRAGLAGRLRAAV
jgi:hypothetical protein